jgi:hypothetical protein
MNIISQNLDVWTEEFPLKAAASPRLAKKLLNGLTGSAR